MSLPSNLTKILLPKRNLGAIKIGEEDRICIEFANYLRQLTFEGKLKYTWFHVPNQFGGYKALFGLKQGWMGRHPGVPDFCFIGEDGHNSFFIEFKTQKGKLSESQKIYIDWCKDCGVPVYICMSFEEAKKIIENVKC